MKILIIQEKGRHKENENFREALNFKRALERAGVDCIVWGLNYDNFKIPFEDIQKECDVIILLENYEQTPWLPDLSSVKKLKLFWSIDSHCVLGSHLMICKKNKIDIVLNAIESDMAAFKKNHKVIYFPNAYPSDLIYHKPDVEKKYDIGFCGGDGNRASWFDFLSKNVNFKRDDFVIGNSMVNAINSYRIHFNRNIANDINYRTFETLGVKTLLLTNYTENLENLFKIGEHLVIYDSQQDLLDKIKYYINNESEKNKIQEFGYKHVIENHTYDVRAKQIIDIINQNI